jgi:hypothetical protein
MPGQGVGGLVYLSDEQENVSRVSTAGRAYFSDSYSRLKVHSPINVISASGGSTFESAPVGKMYVRSESGNAIMWLGGTGDDSPYSGHGFPLWGGETSPILYVNDFSSVRVCSRLSGQIVYAIGFLNGEDVTLSRSSPELPDVTAPLLISHSPISGLSGVSRDSEITATFNEQISSVSVISGAFRLSPAHDVTVFRDTTNTSKIVMTPNVLLSGSTVYMAEVTQGITDRVGNPVSGITRWPFTTAAAPPPPDTTPPVISGTSPVSGATEVAIDSNVTITFSEAMLSGTINTTNIFLATMSGAASPGDVASTVTLDAGDRKTVTIDPTASLAEASTYYFNVSTGVMDLASNAMVSALSNRPFTTVANLTQVYHVTGTTDFNPLNSGGDTRCGLTITGSCDLKGATVVPKKVVVVLKKSGSPTGTISIVLRGGSNDLVATTFGTMDAASLTTSFTEYTFTNLNATANSDSNGDKILVEFSGGDSSNQVLVQRNASDVYSGAAYVEFQSDSTYATLGSRDVCMTVYADV